MAENPQAMAVKIKRKMTAGPPLLAAWPMVEKIPAPTIAAIPRAVKSLALKVLDKEDSPKIKGTSGLIWSIDFFLKSLFMFMQYFQGLSTDKYKI